MTAPAELLRSMSCDLDTLVGHANDLSAILEGLDVLHVTGHVYGPGGAYPEGASEVERRALNALGPMIQMALRMALDLAEGLDALSRAQSRNERTAGQ
jgi:hypothetical protein